MKQMRIALLCWESRHSIAVGGLAEHVTELAFALQRRGHEVHLFTRIGPGQETLARVGGVYYHRCPYEPHPDFLIDNRRMCDSFVWHLAETQADLGKPFDVVHGHDWLVVRAMEQAKHRHRLECGFQGHRSYDVGRHQDLKAQEQRGAQAALELSIQRVAVRLPQCLEQVPERRV